MGSCTDALRSIRDKSLAFPHPGGVPSSDQLTAALHDPAASLARHVVARQVGQALSDVADLLFASGHLLGPDRADGASPFGHGNDREVGVATVAQIGGELVRSAATLTDASNLYSAMALVRQLVEVEYLLWAFGSRAAEADGWLRSSHEERIQMWQPRHLRAKSDGKFGTEDYQNHCNRGGHPTPEARFLLPGHSVRLPAEAVWVELAQHGMSCWDHLVTAVAELESLESLGPVILERASTQELHRNRQVWEACDNFPSLARSWALDRQQRR